MKLIERIFFMLLGLFFLLAGICVFLFEDFNSFSWVIFPLAIFGCLIISVGVYPYDTNIRNKGDDKKYNELKQKPTKANKTS